MNIEENMNIEDKGEYKGKWNPTGSYTVGDVVLHETGYWLKLAVTEIGNNDTPPPVPPTNET